MPSGIGQLNLSRNSEVTYNLMESRLLALLVQVTWHVYYNPNFRWHNLTVKVSRTFWEIVGQVNFTFWNFLDNDDVQIVTVNRDNHRLWLIGDIISVDLNFEIIVTWQKCAIPSSRYYRQFSCPTPVFWKSCLKKNWHIQNAYQCLSESGNINVYLCERAKELIPYC